MLGMWMRLVERYKKGRKRVTIGEENLCLARQKGSAYCRSGERDTSQYEALSTGPPRRCTETHSHLDVLIRLLAGLAVLALEEGLTVLVELEGGNDNVGRADADGDGGTRALLAVDAVDVDNPLLAVDLGDLALAALVCTTDNLDLVILADGDRAGL